MVEILDKTHHKWEDFITELSGSDYCDFSHFDYENEPTTPLRNYEEGLNLSWICDGTHQLTKKLLADYKVDMEATIKFFEKHGGFCTCEVYFNVTEAQG